MLLITWNCFRITYRVECDVAVAHSLFTEKWAILVLNMVAVLHWTVAFKIYDIDRDGYISNGELFHVLKMMVGANLKDAQLQQIVDKTIINADTDGDGKISFEEFCMVWSCISAWWIMINILTIALVLWIKPYDIKKSPCWELYVLESQLSSKF